MKYRFTVTIVADGVAFKSGDIVERGAIPSACFDSLLRTGQIVPIPAEPPKRK